MIWFDRAVSLDQTRGGAENHPRVRWWWINSNRQAFPVLRLSRSAHVLVAALSLMVAVPMVRTHARVQSQLEPSRPPSAPKAIDGISALECLGQVLEQIRPVSGARRSEALRPGQSLERPCAQSPYAFKTTSSLTLGAALTLPEPAPRPAVLPSRQHGGRASR
jgi:hypothetical protein